MGDTLQLQYIFLDKIKLSNISLISSVREVTKPQIKQTVVREILCWFGNWDKNKCRSNITMSYLLYTAKYLLLLLLLFFYGTSKLSTHKKNLQEFRGKLSIRNSLLSCMMNSWLIKVVHNWRMCFEKC